MPQMFRSKPVPKSFARRCAGCSVGIHLVCSAGSVLDGFDSGYRAGFPSGIISRNPNIPHLALHFQSHLAGVNLLDAPHVPHFSRFSSFHSLYQSSSRSFTCIIPGPGYSRSRSFMILFFMVEGISKIVPAPTIRPFPNWRWVFARGSLKVLLAFLSSGGRHRSQPFGFFVVLLDIGLISEGAPALRPYGLADTRKFNCWCTGCRRSAVGARPRRDDAGRTTFQMAPGLLHRLASVPTV